MAGCTDGVGRSMATAVHSTAFFSAMQAALRDVSQKAETLEQMVSRIGRIRDSRGRLFLIGVGGGAANCSHAVNDFRKLCRVEAYAPTDNVAEVTARTNDDGWDRVFIEWLAGSNLNSEDGVFVFSVGGGNVDKNVSSNISKAVEYAHDRDATIMGVVGSSKGRTAQLGSPVLIVPTVDERLVTPITEAMQMVVLHFLVSHPFLQKQKTKW